MRCLLYSDSLEHLLHADGPGLPSRSRCSIEAGLSSAGGWQGLQPAISGVVNERRHMEDRCSSNRYGTYGVKLRIFHYWGMAMRNVTLFLAASVVMWTLSAIQVQASEKETLSAGTILAVRLDSDSSMKAGTPVHGHVMEAVYSHDRLVIPVGTHVIGKIVQLQPAAHDRRMNAKLQGDFTPLHEAAVEFQQMTLPNGQRISFRPLPQHKELRRCTFRVPIQRHITSHCRSGCGMI